jgi:hypothetical protein
MRVTNVVPLGRRLHLIVSHCKLHPNTKGVDALSDTHIGLLAALLTMNSATHC